MAVRLVILVITTRVDDYPFRTSVVYTAHAMMARAFHDNNNNNNKATICKTAHSIVPQAWDGLLGLELIVNETYEQESANGQEMIFTQQFPIFHSNTRITLPTILQIHLSNAFLPAGIHVSLPEQQRLPRLFAAHCESLPLDL